MITYTNRGNGKNAHESYKNYQCKRPSTIPHELLHDSLYDYKDLIDYESLIYVICKRCKVDNRYIMKENTIDDIQQYEIFPFTDNKDYTNFVERMCNIYMQSSKYSSELKNIESNYPNDRNDRIANLTKILKITHFF